MAVPAGRPTIERGQTLSAFVCESFTGHVGRSYHDACMINRVIKTIAGSITQGFALLVLLGAVAGALKPNAFAWVLHLINPLLGIIMLGMGMTLRIDDFKRVVKQPVPILSGVVCQFTCMSLLAWLISRALHLDPMLTVGMVLVGTCPGGTASNVITFLAKGDVALSVSMTTLSTLLSPILTPLLTLWLAGQQVPVNAYDLFVSIVQIVLLPIILGVGLRRWLHRPVQACLPVFPVISVLAIVLIVGAVVGANAARLSSQALPVALAVVLHNGLGYLSGFIVAWRLHLSSSQMKALTVEIGMQNSGLAVGLANRHFSSLAALPAALFSVWHNVSGACLASFWQWRDSRIG